MIEDADLVLCMAAEHRSDASSASTAEEAARTFTLKELVRLLERLPPTDAGKDPASLSSRVAEADVARRNGKDAESEEDVQDPYGDSAAAHQAIVVEIREWTRRLVVGLYGADSAIPCGVSSDG